MHNVKIIGADQAKDGVGQVTSLVAVTQAAKLFSVLVFNNSAGDLYYLLFDAAAVPANGTTPNIPPVRVPANSQGSIDFGDGRQFYAGIVVAASSTIPTLTLAGASSWISANFRKTS